MYVIIYSIKTIDCQIQISSCKHPSAHLFIMYPFTRGFIRLSSLDSNAQQKNPKHSFNKLKTVQYSGGQITQIKVKNQQVKKGPSDSQSE